MLECGTKMVEYIHVFGISYVKCMCALSRYHMLVVEICYMLNVCVRCLGDSVQ